MHDIIHDFFTNLNDIHKPADLSEPFSTGNPVPFIIIDNFLPQDVYRQIITQFYEISDNNYMIFENKVSRRKECRNMYQAPLLQTLSHCLNGSLFIKWLEQVSDTEKLVPDPHLRGGGFCRSPRGTSLGLHTDFNWNDQIALNRKINIIFYMNQSWNEDWNGHLEFWNNDRTQCLQKIYPYPNRLAIWLYDINHVHGHPEPIMCPEDLSRDSLIHFYYTSNAIPEHDPRRSHFPDAK